MSSQARKANWQVYLFVSLALMALALAVAMATGRWALTAIPIGFLFGFFLQKGDLCGASAFSEILVFRSWSKMWGLWICIVTGMVGFAVLEGLGWVKLSPKPMVWLNYVIGGVLFGIGTVLAGGCVSGCLFKTGTGNINSMVALLGIPIGAAIIEYGPLNGAQAWMMKQVVKAGDGGAVTLVSLTGIPFWGWAVGLAGLTAACAAVFHPRRPATSPAREFRNPLTRSWKPWVAGLAIGLLNVVAYVSSDASGRNYPLGVTHGVLQAELLAFDKSVVPVWRKAPAAPAAIAPAPATPAAATPAAPPARKVSVWLVALVFSVVAGAWVSGRLAGQARLLPRPPEQTVIAFFGGLLVGLGAAIAGGCVVGNILSGWALLSVGTILFGVVVILANLVTTQLYLIGGGIGDIFGGGKR